ncbi:MAG TPA: S24 family peptidase [Alphaproteobacteria bacterium]|nr:S24 family peptidase [Alphaproteobacteria bacterium]
MSYQALLQIIDARLKAKGLTERQASLQATKKPDSIRTIRRGNAPKPRTLKALAAVLECDERILFDAAAAPDAAPLAADAPATEQQSSLDPPPNAVPAGIPAIDFNAMRRDVEVHGTAIGGDDGDFQLNGGTIDYAKRPPGIIGRKGVFAIFTQGDSMYPWRSKGDLVYLDPVRPARPGDYVVVECHGRDHEPGPAYLKRLVAETATKVRLAQYNPADDRIEIPKSRIKRIYRVIDWPELLGF